MRFAHHSFQVGHDLSGYGPYDSMIDKCSLPVYLKN